VRGTGAALAILACVLIGAAGQIVLKLGVSSPAFGALLNEGKYPEFLVKTLLSPLVLAGLLLYAASTVIWLAVLARSDLSFAYPFISIGFVVTTLFGWLALGEAMSPGRLGGVALIIAGVVFVARS
jgi:drug/metabolite transporter (DMT)-like permease